MKHNLSNPPVIQWVDILFKNKNVQNFRRKEINKIKIIYK